jgi:hypothetical protein
MQGHPRSTKLSQILNPDSPSIDFNPSRLRCRLIIEFKLQLMIKRLLAVVVRVMLRSRLFASSAARSIPSRPASSSLPSQATTLCRGPFAARYDSTSAQYAVR